VLAKHAGLKRTRDAARVGRALDALETAAAAAADTQNLMPLLVECCHAYATVGEMVQRLKRCWGEFQEPVRL
jgi:methylmalonyl-CoA mutase N-terminal domain/subunit